MTTGDVPTEIGDLCTLPAVERPLRAAEFDDLFRHGMAEFVRVDDTVLELLMEGSWSDTARDLARRETTCCSFFTFSFHAAAEAGRVWMRIAVPAGYGRILDAVAEAARGALG